MRNLIWTRTVTSIASGLALATAMLVTSVANAAPTVIDPLTTVGGLPPAGAPSFVFNDRVNNFGSNVQSWFENYVIIQNEGGAGGSYNFFAHNQGSFTYWDSMTSSMGGSEGSFDLSATFDSNGVLQAGGTVQITGAIAGLDISDPNTVLMTAELVGFEVSGDTIGFAISNIVCDDAIEGCATDANQVESIYFGMTGDFQGISELNGANYRSTMSNRTTVPVPAAAWLMLSGIACLGAVARRQKSA